MSHSTLWRMKMNKIGSWLSLSLVGMACLLLNATPAQAQAWVSGVGDDNNPCSRVAPCQSFSVAISKIGAGGIISCLDPGFYAAVTITKSITIDCTGTYGG